MPDKPTAFGFSRRQALSSLAGLSLAVSACSAPRQQAPAPAGAVPRPRVNSGQRWRYQRINRFNQETLGEVLAEVIQVTPQLVIRLSDENKQTLGEEIYSQPWQVLQDPFYPDSPRFQNPLPLLPGLLKAGATEHSNTAWQAPDGRSGNPWLSWNSRLKATGWERITVPAGRFDCLRIERRSRFEAHQMGRFNAYRDETLWYCPAVNRWAMREWAGFYLDETTMAGDRGGPPTEEREDTIRWVLTDFQSAPISG